MHPISAIKYNCIAYSHCLNYFQITTALFWFACLFYQTAFCDGLNKSNLERDCTCESDWIIKTLSGGHHHSVYRVWHMRTQVFPFLPCISHGRIAFACMRSHWVLCSLVRSFEMFWFSQIFLQGTALEVRYFLQI